MDMVSQASQASTYSSQLSTVTAPHYYSIDGITCLFELSESTRTFRLKCTCYNFIPNDTNRNDFIWTQCAKGALNILEKSTDIQRLQSTIVAVVEWRHKNTGQCMLLVLTQHKKIRSADKNKFYFINVVSSVTIKNYDDTEAQSKVVLKMNGLFVFKSNNVIYDGDVIKMTGDYLLWLDKNTNSICHVDKKGPRVAISMKTCNTKWLQILTVYKQYDVDTVIGFYCVDGNLNKKVLFISQFYIDEENLLVQKPLVTSEIAKFLPLEYVPIICCVHIDELTIDNDVISYSSVFVVTSQCHLLHFRDGKLTRFVAISNLADISNVSCVKYSGRYRDMIIIVSYPVVNVYQCDEDLQLIHEEDQVRHLLIDDFISRGLPQLLFIKAEPSPFPHCQWTLTDLCGCYYDKLNVGSESPESREDKTGVTSALEKRLQHDNLMIEEKISDINERKALIQSTCDNLAALSIGSHTPLQQVSNSFGMVTLCGNEYNIKDEKIMDNDKDVMVRRLWATRVDDVCVIGVQVSNLTDKTMSQLSVTPVLIGQSSSYMWESHSKWPISDCVPSLPDTDDDCNWIYQPIYKKQRTKSKANLDHRSTLPPGRKCYVLCLLGNCDLILPADYNVFVNFNWIRNVADSSHRPAMKFCGHVTLDVNKPPALTQSELSLCKDFLFDHSTAYITSSSPINLRMSLEKCGFMADAGIPNRFHSPSMTLDKCQVQLYSDDGQKMTLLTRNKHSLCELIRFLYNNLPDYAIIVPDSDAHAQQPISTTASSNGISLKVDGLV